MSLRLYDTATREIAGLEPLRPGEVSVYHCGLTVQSSPHLGHLRKEVVFDVLRRWLEWHGLIVTVVANVTDIDDKILTRAAEAGVPWFVHAYRYERELHQAYAALGCRPPSYEPRATGHVPEMVELIEQLIERGHAYPSPDGSGDVYFDVASWPAYGELSGQRLEDMEPAADADPRGKRDPRDFALWKGRKEGEPYSASWPTPWGRGRPGWHLECSAMAGKYLGDEFDIHGGGIDLRFPHHENEQAQSRAAGRGFARVWLHNGWVTAAGEKMSKSLGNGARVADVVRQYPARAVRLYLVGPHYRSTVEYSDTSLTEATAALARIDGFVERALRRLGPTPPPGPGADLPAGTERSAPPVEVERPALPAEFVAAMDDDLGTPGALAVLYAEVREGNTALAGDDEDAVAARLSSVQAMLDVLGLRADDPVWGEPGGDDLNGVVDALVGSLLQQRTEARAARDWAGADAVRDSLAAAGIAITDTPDGPQWSLGTKEQ